jgi:hypothetical protein
VSSARPASERDEDVAQFADRGESHQAAIEAEQRKQRRLADRHPGQQQFELQGIVIGRGWDGEFPPQEIGEREGKGDQEGVGKAQKERARPFFFHPGLERLGKRFHRHASIPLREARARPRAPRPVSLLLWHIAPAFVANAVGQRDEKHRAALQAHVFLFVSAPLAIFHQLEFPQHRRRAFLQVILQQPNTLGAIR